MKILLLTLLILPTQDKTVQLTGVTGVTSPGIPSAPVLVSIR